MFNEKSVDTDDVETATIVTTSSAVCKPPPWKSGAINETEEVEIRQNYTYRCQDGLFGKRDQSPRVTCLLDGSWTQTNFTCGAIIETAEVETGQNYTYKCHTDLIGKRDLNPTVMCQDDVKQNWTQDTIYPKNIHKSEVISNETGITFWECMQRCDDSLTKCLSFFYDNLNSHCVLSSSFQRGLPEAPSNSCDMGYINVLLGDSSFCIKYHSEMKVFNEAMKLCESERAKLLVVTKEVLIYLLMMNIGQSGWTYTGVSDEASEGHWVKWTGDEVFISWSFDEPNGGPSENCGVFGYRKNGMFDISCNNILSFICHKKLV
ncbi:hypothetical protein CHS0354_011563 [Potamilus streckersoni]|uniref:C-type lectin domain-containing protein n=1 Tax=Potamilus streckersoni TaxID=2493646 RepID=A0AAE0RRZ2_9BIVA|nr:hypothetical protein CHS0354_011563 [Potamilus streckersoni]